jgi:hypothetical protein
VEIILGQARRRWSEDEKRALVAELRASITSVEACCLVGANNIARHWVLLRPHRRL